MFDESLRRRLEALNREPLPRTAPSIRRTVLPHAGSAGPDAVRLRGNLLDCGEVVETSAGKHLRVVRSVEEVWDNGERLVAARHEVLKQSLNDNGHATGHRAPDEVAADCRYRRDARALVASFPDRALFLDLETCGLAGAALFLVGCLRRMDGRLAVELLLARTYAEEKAVLVSLWERVAMHDVLVTFNGKSFDWPMVHDRSTRYLLGRAGSAKGVGSLFSRDADSPPRLAPQPPRKKTPDPVVHMDILHHARRRWRGRLPDCRLLTLERYICGRRREGDIAGVQIPAAYQRFVETGDGREMESILFHNAVDLVTLLDLAMRLAGD